MPLYESTLIVRQDLSRADVTKITDEDIKQAAKAFSDLVAEIEMMFVHLDQNMAGETFGEENFVFSEDFVKLLRMRTLRTAFVAKP